MICSGQRIADGIAGFFVVDRWRLKGALGAGRTSPSSFTRTHPLISDE
jgi:hypothetical protein